MPLACVLQHIRCEPPGPVRRAAPRPRFSGRDGRAGRGRVPARLARGEPRAGDGRPDGRHDEAAHPWLAAEKRWIAAAVRCQHALPRRVPRRAAAGREPRRARCARGYAGGRRPAGRGDRGRAGRPGVRRARRPVPGPAVARRHVRHPAWQPSTSPGPPPTRARRSGSAPPRTACSSTSRSPTRCSPSGGRCPRTRSPPRRCWGRRLPAPGRGVRGRPGPRWHDRPRLIVHCLARPGQQHELTITRHRLSHQ